MYPMNFLTNIIPTQPFSAASNFSIIYPTYKQDTNIQERDYSNLKPLVIQINPYPPIYQTGTLNYLNKCFLVIQKYSTEG